MKLPSLNLGSTIRNLRTPKQSKLFLSLIPSFKEERTRKFTTLALSFITIAFFGLFAINPTVGTISDLQKQIDDSTFVNQALQKKIANLTTLQDSYSQIQSQLTPIYDAIPATPALDTLAGQIHQIAQQTGIGINRVQTLPVDLSATATAAAPYLSYAFSVEAQGTIDQLRSFVQQLASFNRLVTFDTISYTRVGRLDPTFRVTVRGKAYFKSEGQ